MPPIQWVKERQNKMPLCRCSISVRIVAPVVVKPDTVSNSASIYEGIAPEITNGNAPNKLSTIQLSATITKPSFASSIFPLGMQASSAS